MTSTASNVSETTPLSTKSVSAATSTPVPPGATISGTAPTTIVTPSNKHSTTATTKGKGRPNTHRNTKPTTRTIGIPTAVYSEPMETGYTTEQAPTSTMTQESEERQCIAPQFVSYGSQVEISFQSFDPEIRQTATEASMEQKEHR